MCESSPARPKASDLESGLVGVLVFESHLSHQVGVEINGRNILVSLRMEM